MSTMAAELDTPTIRDLFPEPGLGLTAPELEDVIAAVIDREEVAADPGLRARLARGRAALERDLARALEA